MRNCIKCNEVKSVLLFENDNIICKSCHEKRLISLINEAENNLNKNTNCIYIINCLVNNYIYIGSSSNFQKRLTGHKNKLIANKHSNTLLQNDFNKYGLLNFDFYILEHNVINYKVREYELIHDYLKTHNLYNISLNSRELMYY